MSIPDFQTLMLPVLRSAALGEQRISNTVEKLAVEFALTPEERSQFLPSGRQTTFANRVHWAKSYLGKAGLVELSGRGRFKITCSGREVLKQEPDRINIQFLKRLHTPQERTQDDIPPYDYADGSMTLDERMRQARDQLEEELGRELLARVVKGSPQFFERLVVRLLISKRWPASSGQCFALDRWTLCRLPMWYAIFGVARRAGVARPE